MRVAKVTSSPQLIEGPQSPPAPPAVSHWVLIGKIFLWLIPVLVAILSTAGLAYFLLSQRLQPQSQVQPPQPAPQQQAQAQPQAQAPQPQLQAPPPGPIEPEPPVPNPLPPMPNGDKLLVLINTALIALNQANQTGNYTVLYDMAAPGFKRVNNPQRLAQIFSNLRARRIDLSPIILFEPKLYRQLEMNDRGMLRVTGFYPTAPERVNFDLIFQPVRGSWRLYGITANTQPAPPPAAPPQPSPGSSAPAKPGAAQATKPGTPAKKPPAKSSQSEDSSTKTSEMEDVRDRIDNPPAPPPESQQPKPNSIWNPFTR